MKQMLFQLLLFCVATTFCYGDIHTGGNGDNNVPVLSNPDNSSYGMNLSQGAIENVLQQINLVIRGCLYCNNAITLFVNIDLWFRLLVRRFEEEYDVHRALQRARYLVERVQTPLLLPVFFAEGFLFDPYIPILFLGNIFLFQFGCDMVRFKRWCSNVIRTLTVKLDLLPFEFGEKVNVNCSMCREEKHELIVACVNEKGSSHPFCEVCIQRCFDKQWDVCPFCQQPLRLTKKNIGVVRKGIFLTKNMAQNLFRKDVAKLLMRNLLLVGFITLFIYITNSNSI